MTIKFKQTKEGTFTIKGLGLEHLQAIMTLVNNTRCGSGLYENAVFELCDAFDAFDVFVCPVLDMDDCVLDAKIVYHTCGIAGGEVLLSLSHFTD